MAGDWIKMRVWIARDPRVITMADYLSEDRAFMDWLTDPVRQSCKESAYEHVTRNVTVALCVTALLVTWGTAREQGDRDGDDLVVRFATLSTLDAMTDLPGFGDAMAHVGWVEECDGGGICFPKFFKDMESPDEKHKRQAAERQARFRAKKSLESNDQSNVTSNVTVTHREEKRREEKELLSGKPEVIEVLNYLNEKAQRDYRPVDSNLKLISARLSEGATVAECKQVIDAKVKKWLKDEKMAEYLRPATLFNATNFAQYVGELGSAQVKHIDDWRNDPRFKGAK